LGNLAADAGHEIPGVAVSQNPVASYGIMAEKSPGKDTTTGHWRSPAYNWNVDFPRILKVFPMRSSCLSKRLQGRKTLGNRPAIRH